MCSDATRGRFRPFLLPKGIPGDCTFPPESNVWRFRRKKRKRRKEKEKSKIKEGKNPNHGGFVFSHTRPIWSLVCFLNT